MRIAEENAPSSFPSPTMQTPWQFHGLISPPARGHLRDKGRRQCEGVSAQQPRPDLRQLLTTRRDSGGTEWAWQSCAPCSTPMAAQSAARFEQGTAFELTLPVPTLRHEEKRLDQLPLDVVRVSLRRRRAPRRTPPPPVETARTLQLFARSGVLNLARTPARRIADQVHFCTTIAGLAIGS